MTITKRKPDELTFGDLMDRYTKSPAFCSMTPSSQRTYTTYLRPLAGLRPKLTSQVSTDDLGKIWGKMNRTPGALSQSRKVCRRMLSWGVEEGLLDKRMTPDIVVSRRHTPRPHEPWTGEEIARFREAAKDYAIIHPEFAYVIDFFEVALATGQRLSDICEMRSTGYQNGLYNMVQKKTGARLQFKPAGAFLALLLKSNRPYVIDMGKPYHGREHRFRYHFDAVRDAAKVDKTFHGLRKNVALTLREKGASNAQIAALLGHTTTRMVEDYAKFAQKTVLASAAAEILAEAFKER